jgi:hypothetical protein
MGYSGTILIPRSPHGKMMMMMMMIIIIIIITITTTTTTTNFSLHHRVQNGSGAHSASYPMGTRGSFHGGKEAGT